MLTSQDLIEAAKTFVETDPGNRIAAEWAMAPDVVGVRMYEPPIFAFGSAEDPLFAEFKKPEVVHERHMLPTEWLPEAKSVVTLFLPAARRVKDSNARDMVWPSIEWMHARVEGQQFILKLSNHLKSLLEAEGFAAVVPAGDPRFWTGIYHKVAPGETPPPHVYASNWSERHAAYASGLGTFCLSKGMITEKGVCGRFASVITAHPFPVTPRPYTGIYDYCTFCGACVRHCPAKAISLEHGKDHPLCEAYVGETLKRWTPHYGCAKCQVKTPCESGIPVKRP